MAERAEGWYTDPYGRHEARWMSDGTPTELVRDRGVESHDAPPDEEPSQTPELVAEAMDEAVAGAVDEAVAGEEQAGGQDPTGSSHVAGPEINEDE